MSMSPYYCEDFDIGGVTFVPNGDDSPEESAVCVEIDWLEDADEEDVDQRLETWLGMPCLAWFRLSLNNVIERDASECKGYDAGWNHIYGYTDLDTARELKANSTGHVEHSIRGVHNG